MNLKMPTLNFIYDETFMFKINTGLKFVFISLFFTFSTLFFTFIVLKIDLNYFLANGYPEAIEFQEAFYNFVASSIIDTIPYLLLILLLIFYFGFYLSKIMLRPFRIIADYCEKRLTNEAYYFSTEIFSNLKLLFHFFSFSM